MPDDLYAIWGDLLHEWPEAERPLREAVRTTALRSRTVVDQGIPEAGRQERMHPSSGTPREPSLSSPPIQARRPRPRPGRRSV